MISDYAFTGTVASTAQTLMEFHPSVRTYYYQFGYSGSQSLCDKHVYYGWKYSVKLQLQNLGFGYNMRNGHGICRGDEMMTLFIFGKEPPPVSSGPLTETDKKMTKQMTGLWAQFANFSKPSTEFFHWHPMEKSTRR